MSGVTATSTANECADLMRQNVAELHLYAMNRAEAAVAIFQRQFTQ